jgi:hypothetical protein
MATIRARMCAMTSPHADDRWRQWQEWYEVAHNEVMTLFHHRHVWKSLVALLNANPAIEHHSVINDWLTRGYSQTIAVGIRRQCDSSRRRPTLGCLLSEMAAHPDALTVDRYMAAAKPDQDPVATSAFWAAYATEDRSRLDGKVVGLDRQVLRDGTRVARRWTNRVVTHRDADSITGPVNLAFADLDAALDILGALIQRYHGLFHPGSSLYCVTPYIPHTWTNMFQVPWLSEGFEPVDPSSLG